MKKALAVASILIFSLVLVPAAGHADWLMTYPSGISSTGYSVKQTTDGGYIFTGVVKNPTTWDANVWLVKTDVLGNEQWEKNYGSPGGSECGYSVQQTSDGGYIIAGTASLDVWLIKTDASGNSQWDKRYDRSVYDEGYSVQQTSDGGYIVTGITAAHVFLLKTDASGVEQWSKTYGTSDYELGYSVQQTSDGGFIIAGLSGSDWDHTDALLIKTDSAGNQQWRKTFGGNWEDAAYCVRQTSDGGYILTGQFDTLFGTDLDLWLIKTDPSGNKQWDKVFGGRQFDCGFSVRQDSDGGYAVAGTTVGSGTGRDVWFIKTDSGGNELWDVTHGLNETDEGRDMSLTDDGGYIITGYSYAGPEQYGHACLVKVERQITELTAITLQSPVNGATVSSPPTFTWSPNGGSDDAFAVDISFNSRMRNYWSTYDDLKLQITENSWTPSLELWNQIPSGSTLYWRVRGVDRALGTTNVIKSGTWSFHRP